MSKTIFTICIPPVSPLCFLLRNKVLMHLCVPPSKRCPFQWLIDINSQSLSEGALGTDGTCWNTVAARAGGGCSAQRATTSGTKSHAFFLLLENLPLRSHFGSVENKQKQCCRPEIIAPARSRKGAEGKNSGCYWCHDLLTSHWSLWWGLECVPTTPKSLPTAMAFWLCKMRKGKGSEIPRAISDSRPWGKQWTDIPILMSSATRLLNPLFLNSVLRKSFY